jgi:hypothetical protein
VYWVGRAYKALGYGRAGTGSITGHNKISLFIIEFSALLIQPVPTEFIVFFRSAVYG